uniref:Glutathione S-transferase T3-like n=1 Tax=Tanacetum cinerariifolium TaxID=118510 RepID=A0A699ICK6_TANCI|nr:hypothetical protein [Tanacetum cinerariifolium]
MALFETSLIPATWVPGLCRILNSPGKCFFAVSEDRNVGRSQSRETLWYRVLNEINQVNFQNRNKDMFSSKWNTLNHNCQKFNAIYKRCNRLKKSSDDEVDLMKRARGIYRDENKNNTFNHDDAWAIWRKHSKWDAPDPAPVDLREGENVPDEHVPAVHTEELFGPDARPLPPAVKKAFKVVKEKDWTITRLEELRFIALSTKDLSDDDTYYINLQKAAIKEKLRLQMTRHANNNDETEDDE